MTTFFTSDLHLGHRFVANMRGYDDLVAYNDFMIDACQVPGDLFILGDLAMSGWQQNLSWISRLNCSVFVILGNHDRPHPVNKNAHRHFKSFMAIGDIASANTAGVFRDFMLSHFPYDGDHTTEDRCEDFRLKDMGRPLLHGHTHSADKVSWSSQGTLQLHVGFDAWQRPVSYEELLEVKVNALG